MSQHRNRTLKRAGSGRALRPLLLVLALVAPAVVVPGTAVARGGGPGGGGGGDRPEVRVAGVCGKGATAKLKLKSRDGAIEAEFEVDHNRAGTRWRVVVVQERRVVYRGYARTGGASGSFSLERRLGDYPGADAVMARAVGPRGLTCQATAVLPG
jgi:hypothetical protein